VPHYRDEAIVLRTHKLGEVDRILTLLTRHHGQVRAVAKGIRKTSSRFGARLEPFMACDLQLYEGKNLDTVSQAEQIANYGATIVNDYSRYTVASTIVETAEKLTRELSNEKHYLLVVGALRTLAQAEIQPTQILDSYLLRALSLSGWVPLLESCSQCGSEPSSFSMHTGSVTCSQCVAAGSVKIGRAGLEHMQSLMAGEWDKVTSQSFQIKQAVSSVVAGYMQWQLERGLRSLNFVERA